MFFGIIFFEKIYSDVRQANAGHRPPVRIQSQSQHHSPVQPLCSRIDVLKNVLIKPGIQPKKNTQSTMNGMYYF